MNIKSSFETNLFRSFVTRVGMKLIACMRSVRERPFLLKSLNKEELVVLTRSFTHIVFTSSSLLSVHHGEGTRRTAKYEEKVGRMMMQGDIMP